MQLHTGSYAPAHTHLSSFNIMINQSDLHIYIADYNLKSLKKFAKIFNGYQNVNPWSAPEVQQSKNDFSDQIATDSYSYGMLLWELETRKIPFKGLTPEDIKTRLIE